MERDMSDFLKHEHIIGKGTKVRLIKEATPMKIGQIYTIDYVYDRRPQTGIPHDVFYGFEEFDKYAYKFEVVLDEHHFDEGLFEI